MISQVPAPISSGHDGVSRSGPLGAVLLFDVRWYVQTRDVRAAEDANGEVTRCLHKVACTARQDPSFLKSDAGIPMALCLLSHARKAKLKEPPS